MGGVLVFEALRIRDFRLLWFARTVSLLGSWLLVIAVPAHVFALTGSLAATGLTLAAEFLPPVLLGPVAGVLVDRWDRRRVMIVADLARAVAVGLLLLVGEPGDLWLVYAALVAESVSTVLFRPAAQAHTPVVVGTGTALAGANALNAVTDGAVRLIGAPLGGALLGWAGFTVLVWVDLGSYLLSAVALALTARVAAGRERDGQGVRRVLADLREGLDFLRGARTVRGLLMVNALFLGANAALTALLVPFGMTVLGGSGQIGLVMSALGLGFLVGAPAVAHVIDRIAPGWLLCAALSGAGAGFGLLFSATGLPRALAAAVLIGAAGSMALVAGQTTVQRITPNQVLGRMSAAMFTAEAAATLVGAVLGPAAAVRLGLTTTAYIAGAATVACGVLAVVVLPRRLPDDGVGRSAQEVR
ncbi:MFS transporter [Actinokineospora sp. 24-640]